MLLVLAVLLLLLLVLLPPSDLFEATEGEHSLLVLVFSTDFNFFFGLKKNVSCGWLKKVCLQILLLLPPPPVLPPKPGNRPPNDLWYSVTLVG